jgi:hypothetical protein
MPRLVTVAEESERLEGREMTLVIEARTVLTRKCLHAA